MRCCKKLAILREAGKGLALIRGASGHLYDGGEGLRPRCVPALPSRGVATTAMRAETTAVRAETTAMRADPTAMRGDTTAVRADPTAMRADPTAVRADTTAVRADTTAVRADTTAVRADTTATATHAIHFRHAPMRGYFVTGPCQGQ
jgi:hypothetical protein